MAHAYHGVRVCVRMPTHECLYCLRKNASARVCGGWGVIAESGMRLTKLTVNGRFGKRRAKKDHVAVAQHEVGMTSCTVYTETTLK